MGAVDYTSRIDPAALKAAGVTDVFRYLCYEISPGVPNPKVIQQREYDELIAAGIGVTLNWEFDEKDWNHGYTAGQLHGSLAGTMANERGYPKGCTIFGSADYDMPYTDWITRAQYYARGFADGVTSHGYKPGVYGPWDVLRWVSSQDSSWKLWQAGMSTAWSGGRNAAAFPGASVRQRRHITIGGVDTDWNDILIPNWGQARKGQTMAEDYGRAPDPHDGGTTACRVMDVWLAEEETTSPGYGTPTARTKRLQGMTDALARIEAKLNTPTPPVQVSLTDGDRDLINRAIAALTAATPLTASDMQTIGQLRDLLGVVAGHLR